MKVDYELSAELKKKYKHRIRQCYKNTYTLLTNKEIDFFIVGYIYEKALLAYFVMIIIKK